MTWKGIDSTDEEPITMMSVMKDEYIYICVCVCERIYFHCQALFLYFVIWARIAAAALATHIYIGPSIHEPPTQRLNLVVIVP